LPSGVIAIAPAFPLPLIGGPGVSGCPRAGGRSRPGPRSARVRAFKRVNPAFERTLGYSSEELRSRPYVEFVHPDDRSQTLRAAEELSRGRAIVEFENRYLHAIGSVRWLQWSARSAPGEAVIYAAARDVTERKQLEEEQAALRRVATAVARGYRRTMSSPRPSPSCTRSRPPTRPL
jgi:PAS domain S-box-containing protein